MQKVTSWPGIIRTSGAFIATGKAANVRYHTKSEDKSVIIINNPTELKDTGKVKSKKQEIIDAINYIKSKSNKTKKDKESLYSLETVLKSM